VALEAVAPVISAILGRGALYAIAGGTPGRREYTGRGVAYGIVLAGGRVVVRRSRHGGLLAPLTRDVFFAPTRAPYELSVALRLAAFGVLTPQVVAYAVYHAGLGFRRADVVTREIDGARDLSTHPATTEASAAVETLLVLMAKAGAVHPDLNAKNILLADRRGALAAYVIDVDRVEFREQGVDEANRARLRRSIAKLGLAFRV
jgi:3-deoxy-D-manno-octulosonic acid kinase